MERIDQQQTANKAIPVQGDTQAQVRADNPTGTSACSWLSSAMAIWLRDDEGRRPAHPELAAPPAHC